ncbi:MAG: methyltransferase domain-containing protein [Chitinophagaceae bacterium]|nr:methyltransferase domain-containing protein [Chitinophagaceae bacterium]
MINRLVKNYLKKKSFAGTRNEATRLEWLETALKKIPAGSRILDAGAGELDQKKYCSHLNYVSQDFGKYDGVGDSKGLQTKKWDNSKLDIVSDITSIPETDASFDAIMCVEVFEHIPDPISAIKEFSRLLRPGGYLVITAPFCSSTHFAPYHFYTGFNRYFYEKHLSENGFEIMEIDENGNFFEYVAQELLRVPFCAEKYAGKKISIFDKMAIMKSVSMLSKLSKIDKGSKEFLNFGLHVFARKISGNTK